MSNGKGASLHQPEDGGLVIKSDLCVREAARVEIKEPLPKEEVKINHGSIADVEP